MRLLLDYKVSRDYKLNANEACVYAAILKCTRAGKGWYGNFGDLAAALPFVISRDTVRRAILKLIDLGLVVRNAQNAFFATQIEQISAQNAQNDAQNALPPDNPYIYNNMKEKEQQRALHAHDCELQQKDFLNEDFNAFWNAFHPAPEFDNRKRITWETWQKRTPVARKKMLEAVLTGSLPKGEGGERGLNPYFFISDFPEPQPHDYNGTPELESVRDHSRIACYNGHWGIYTLEDIKLFNLQTKD